MRLNSLKFLSFPLCIYTVHRIGFKNYVATNKYSLQPSMAYLSPQYTQATPCGLNSQLILLKLIKVQVIWTHTMASRTMSGSSLVDQTTPSSAALASPARRDPALRREWSDQRDYTHYLVNAESAKRAASTSSTVCWLRTLFQV